MPNIMKRNWDKTISKVAGSIRMFLMRFVKNDRKRISARLDALLVEKAREEGVELALKRPVGFLRALSWFVSAGLAVSAVAALVFFVPGPWTRFFAKPQIVAMSLANLDIGSNGVSEARPIITIQSPKAVRGLQFVRASLSITPEIPFSVELAANSSDIIVTPLADLSPGSVYTVVLEPGVPFTDGTYLANRQSWVIPTKAIFDVVSISPRDGSRVTSRATIEISFTTNEFTLEGVTPAIEFSPSISGSYNKEDSRVVFIPKNGLSVGSQYTVTISTQAKNSSGEQIKKEYASTFSVGYDSSSNTETPRPPGVFFDNRLFNLSSKGIELKFISNKIPRVAIAVYPVSWNEVRPHVEEFIQKGTYSPAKLVSNKKSVYTQTVSGVADSEILEYYFSLSLDSLEKGIYVVRAVSTTDAAIGDYVVVFKGDFGVYATTRANKTDLELWSFAYETKKTLPGAQVTVGGCTAAGCTSVQGTTNDEGYAKIQSTKQVSYVLVTSNGGTQLLFPQINYASWYAFSGDKNADRNIYAKTIINKPQYLPGSKLQFVTLIREKAAGEFRKIPVGTVYEVYLCPPWVVDDYTDPQAMQASCLYHQSLKTTEYSQIEGSFLTWKRPEDLELVIMKKREGRLVYVDSEFVIVKEIDKPQVQISAKSSKLRYVGNEKAVISGRVTDFVDVGIPNRKVTITGTVVNYDIMHDELLTDPIVVTTDKQGNFTATISLPIASMDLFQAKVWFTLESLDGENTVSAQESVEWDKGEIVTSEAWLDGKSTDSVIPIGSKPKVVFTAESLPDEKPKAKKKFTARVIRLYQIQVPIDPIYDPETRELITDTERRELKEDIVTKTLETDVKGGATLEIPAIKDGEYRVVITDETGAWNVSEEHYLFYVGSQADSRGYEVINEMVSEVRFDKSRATVGEKVKFRLHSTFKKTKQQLVLLTKTNEVISWQFISQSTSAIDIPITREMTGGVEVCVLHPMRAYSYNEAGKTLYAGDGMQLACDSLLVENKQQKLQVKLTPSSVEVKPGKTSPLVVEVNNDAGIGEAAVVGITVVDKALYVAAFGNDEEAIQGALLDLYESQFGEYRNSADSGALSIDANDLIGEGGGTGSGGGGDEARNVRKNFSDNPYWDATILTGSDGKAQIPVSYSDGITTWVVTVWAVTNDYKVGSKVIEVKTKKDVYIDIDRPSRMRVGDTWYPYVRVANDQATAFNGKVIISCNGCMEKAEEFDIALKPRETFEKKLTVKASRLDNVSISAQLKQVEQIIDGVTYPVDVRAVGFEVPFVQIKPISKEGNKIEFTIPEGSSPVLSSASIEIASLPLQVQNSLISNAENAKTIEIAGALANLGALAQYKQFGESTITQSAAQAQAREYVEVLLSRLQSTGGFSFHSYGGVEYPSTISAAYALAEADQGFGDQLVIDSKVLLQITEFLRSSIQSDKVPLTDKIQMAYVFAKLDKVRAAGTVSALLASIKKDELTKTQRAYLALSLYQTGATSEAVKLVVQQEVLNKVDAQSGNYVSGDVSEVTTAIQAYLYAKLSMWVADKGALIRYQNWLLNSCITCLNAYDQSVVGTLLTGSLLPEQMGSSANESVTIALNGKGIRTVTYEGPTSLVLPANQFKQGKNDLTVTTASGRKLFVTLTGNIYRTTFPSIPAQPKVSIKMNASNLVITAAGRGVKAGNSGYYSIKVTALEDLPSSRLAIYLPSGLSSDFLESPSGLSDFIEDNDALTAYGDFARGDAYVAEIQPLKKGQSQMVVLPFIAKRLGVFNGEIVQFSIPSQANSIQVVRGTSVEVK